MLAKVPDRIGRIGIFNFLHFYFRTARGDNQGTALSFVSVKEQCRLDVVEATMAETNRKSEYRKTPYKRPPKIGPPKR